MNKLKISATTTMDGTASDKTEYFVAPTVMEMTDKINELVDKYNEIITKLNATNPSAGHDKV